jgi:hypothetical protein
MLDRALSICGAFIVIIVACIGLLVTYIYELVQVMVSDDSDI